MFKRASARLLDPASAAPPDSLKDRTRSISFFGCSAAIIYAALSLALFPRWTVDDAHITFRYSENLVQHGELNWNPGEDPVEGYTGVLLPLWIAAGMKAGISPFAWARATGIVSFFLTGLCLCAALRRAGARPPFVAGATTLFMTAPIFFTHATSGLETTTFGLSLTLVALTFGRCFEPDARRGRAEAALAGALLFSSLARPEGAQLATMALIGLGAARLREGRAAFAGFAWRLGLIFIAPGLIYFLWRWSYYGYLLPNTFYAKSSGGFDARSMRGLGRFARAYLTAPILTAIIPILMARSLRNRVQSETQAGAPIPKLDPRHAPALLLSLFLVVVYSRYLFSIPVMNYAHRFYGQYYPALLLIIAVIADSAWSRLTNLNPPEQFRGTTAKLILAAAAAQLALNIGLAPGQFKYASNYDHILNAMHVPIGRFLNKVIPPDEWIAVYIDAGAIAYYSKSKTIDMGALNDETIAHGKLTHDQAIDYLYAHRPAALVFTTDDPRRVVFKPASVDIPPAQDYAADPRFKNYVEWKAYGAPPGPLPRSSRQLLFLRKDIAERLPPQAPARTNPLRSD